MQIIIEHSSNLPIYEQIYTQVSKNIVSGELTPRTALPSVRQLAKQLRISALTVKKAYDLLESDGLITTVHGKGSFVAELNLQVKGEQQLAEIQAELLKTIKKAKGYGIAQKDLVELFNLLL